MRVSSIFPCLFAISAAILSRAAPAPQTSTISPPGSGIIACQPICILEKPVCPPGRFLNGHEGCYQCCFVVS
ncbi:hypothetical protein BJ165DRAFT_1467670 [Panaeolus papilionaceus]|nr:hypothetical protein BJ165DRAFT_1467670 [Panaeolus papilionaceus]